MNAFREPVVRHVDGTADSISDMPDSLRPFMVVHDDGEEIIGVSEAAKRLDVSRTTIHNWARRKTLIAWKATRRGLRIPAAQILGSRNVVADLSQVVDVIGDPMLAWTFLTEEWPFEHTVERPLDLLKGGRTEEVLGAAAGFGSVFT